MYLKNVLNNNKLFVYYRNKTAKTYYPFSLKSKYKIVIIYMNKLPSFFNDN